VLAHWRPSFPAAPTSGPPELPPRIVIDNAAGPGYLRGLLVAAAILSLFVAASLMLAQRDAKRLLAYSSVEHAGLFAFAAAIGTTFAIAALLLHVLAHALGKSVAFLAVGELAVVDGTTRIHDLRGLLTRRPVLGGSIAVAFVALLGLPPFGLFASELAIARAGFDAHLGWETAIVFAVLLVATGALLFHGQRVLLGPPDPRSETRLPLRPTLAGPLVADWSRSRSSV